MSVPVFETSDVGVDRAGRRLLDGVSLSVAAGEVVVVMGENGAGKSTLLRVLTGDFSPTWGVVRLNGRPLASWTTLEQARRRAVMSQEATLAYAFTAFEVVLLGRSPHDGGRPGAADRAVARDALQRVDALQFADRAYPGLSGGERARVMLARAFAQVLQGSDPATNGPRALLLDEPSAALDIAHQHAAFAAIRELATAEGIAVIAIVHDVNLALRYADRVALLKAGRLIYAGAADEGLTDAVLTECFAIPMRRIAAGSPDEHRAPALVYPDFG